MIRTAIEHPVIPSSFGFRVMGLPGRTRSRGETINTSAGCPWAAISAPRRVLRRQRACRDFMERGEDVYRAMCDAERELGAHAFFMMDENFLLYRKRALELLELMRANQKPWSLYVFSSANAIRKWTMRELVELGIEWIRLGLESDGNSYQKLKGTDTRSLVDELQSHGIRVLGSTIIGLEHHTPENIADVAACRGAPSALPLLSRGQKATHREVGVAGDGSAWTEVRPATRSSFRAALGESQIFLDRAFRRDYDVNGRACSG